ncbi:secreted PhoX family phosphatase [Bradyrhizobium elkanii]
MTQRFSSPARQSRHWPQPIQGKTAFFVPIRSFGASGPTSSTTPAISWPSVKGRVMPRVVSSFLPPPRSA